MKMNWITNIFKRKENSSTNGVKKKQEKINKVNTINRPVIKDPVNNIQLISFGGELPPAVAIGEFKNRYPDYYKNLYVILDNGHGEDTPGKRSPDGKFREYKFNRVIVSLIVFLYLKLMIFL